jgi:hypothetical protein
MTIQIPSYSLPFATNIFSDAFYHLKRALFFVIFLISWSNQFAATNGTFDGTLIDMFFQNSSFKNIVTRGTLYLW